MCFAGLVYLLVATVMHKRPLAHPKLASKHPLRPSSAAQAPARLLRPGVPVPAETKPLETMKTPAWTAAKKKKARGSGGLVWHEVYVEEGMHGHRRHCHSAAALSAPRSRVLVACNPRERLAG